MTAETVDATPRALPAERQETLRYELEQVLAGRLRPMFHFQPVADVRRGAVAGYEALVRLPTSTGLPPDICLQYARYFGFDMELEQMLVRQALHARRQLPRNTFLSVNASPAFLCSRHCAAVLEQQGSLAGVVMEITESECIQDYREIRRHVNTLVTRGGMVAIDDAGAGYASLKHILELKPNFIKLDRTLVQNCDLDRAKSTMIEVLGAAADRLDAWIITEGVETAPELHELIRLRVPLAQGFFLGRPTPTMGALAPEAVRLLHAAERFHGGADDLALHAQVCPSAHTRRAAEDLLRGGGSLAAVVDEWGRPLEVLGSDGALGCRVLPGAMRCHVSCDPREALQRALTRPPEVRFEPILLTDDEGRLQGAVLMDQLMLALLKPQPNA